MPASGPGSGTERGRAAEAVPEPGPRPRGVERRVQRKAKIRRHPYGVPPYLPINIAIASSSGAVVALPCWGYR